jgi:photosystem II stability/assembly factor-like uncharacterized protein
MKYWLFLFVALLLSSCGATVRHAVLSTRSGATPIRLESAEAGEEAGDDPDEAAEFYLLKRTGGDPLPVERMLAARERAHAMPVYSIASRRFVSPGAKTSGVRDAALGTWQPLGPGNAGGRTRALVIRPDDPNTMYAGTVGGGVWKTTDGGQTWTPLTDLLPSIGIGALAMDPQSPDTLYAGTGEFYTNTNTTGNTIRGAGIFKTTDGGATWTQLAGTTGSSFWYYVNKLVISPNDSRRIYAATWDGIALSVDAGATWRTVLSRPGNQIGCQDLAIRTDQAKDYIFAGCSGGSGVTNPAIYRNVDAAGAGTWDIVFTTPNMWRSTLAIAPSNQSIIYAAVASTETGNYSGGLLGVFRSSSNGDSGSWEMRVSNKDSNFLNTILFSNPRDAYLDVCSGGTRTFTNQGGYDNIIAVDPLNSDVVWVGGIGMFRSDDGGRNWGIASFWNANPPQYAHEDQHVIVFHPNYNGNDNQTLFFANDGGIYRTDNALAPQAMGDRAGCAPFATSVAWSNLNHGYFATQFYHGAVYPGGGAYIGGAQDNGEWRGSDGNGPLDWRRLYTGDGGYTAIDPTDPNVWYGEIQHLTFRRTADGGNTFTASQAGITPTADSNFLFIIPFVMDPTQGKRLYLGGNVLWRTTNGGVNWTAASATLPAANGLISAIAVSPADPNRVVFGTSTGFVFRNNNAPAADRNTVWTSAQPRTGYVSHVEFHPTDPSTVYVTYSQYKSSTSQSHVYVSHDGGATWTGIDGSGNTGIPDIPVFTIIADPLTPSTLYAGADIGVFVSLDSGATWSRDDNPFADTVTETLVLDRSAGQSVLYAFTHGRGVWKTVLPGSGDPCQYGLDNNAASFPAFGGTASFHISAADNCSWSVVTRESAASVSSPAGGHGNGSFTLTVPANASATPRGLTVSAQGQPILISQDAALAASGNDEAGSPFAMGNLPAVVIEDTSTGTESPGDPVHSCTNSADSKTLWYSLTAPAAGTMRLTFTVRQADSGADSGSVMTIYSLASGSPGPEVFCGVTPQSSNVFTPRFVTFPVKQGDSFLVEISATTFKAAAGANLMGGNLTLSAVMQ